MARGQKGALKPLPTICKAAFIDEVYVLLLRTPVYLSDMFANSFETEYFVPLAGGHKLGAVRAEPKQTPPPTTLKKKHCSRHLSGRFPKMLNQSHSDAGSH
ncbi:SJCHGC01720 protein [Anopheles sinensis]|uniref:SJCHGC01720 protein n=1 Tax=Anopheles sinensis TaxID=74873 RepID=A0A084VK58_ANOSI|nr:SJCHGC01720 protein [Anopheles sinensis]